MCLWAIIVMNYQINAYYNNFFPGQSYDDLMYITIVELISYIIADLVFEHLGKRKSAKLYVSAFLIQLGSSIGILMNDP